MLTEDEALDIVVCLGSSCFVRGNSENLTILKRYAAGSEGSAVRLTGSLCQGRCKQSPNVKIAGAFHDGITVAGLQELLRQLDESRAA
jgi:NADH:ubiquinone oxidoreductase subunit E